jgi:hypothetical protein
MTQGIGKTTCLIVLGLAGIFVTEAGAQRQMEHLGRGLVAIHEGEGKVFVGWRLLGTDPDGIAFNLYRSAADGPPVKLNDDPITKGTHFVDAGADDRLRVVRHRPRRDGALLDRPWSRRCHASL